MKKINLEKACLDAIDLLAKEVSEDLKDGKVILIPTETVYGIACDALNDKAIERIYEIKGREKNKPLPVMIGNIEHVSLVARDIPHMFYKIARNFMPGAITVILKKNPNISDIVTGGLDTVGIRMPDHIFALNMIKYFNSPIVATSANISGNPSPVSYDEIENHIKDSCDVLVNQGYCPIGTASTVIDISTDKIKLIREGSISLKEISGIINI